MNRSRASCGEDVEILTTKRSVFRKFDFKSEARDSKVQPAHGHFISLIKLGNLASLSSLIGSKSFHAPSLNSYNELIRCWPSITSRSSLCIPATLVLMW